MNASLISRHTELRNPHRLRQRPDCMQMIGKDDVGADLEGVTGADLLDGCKKQGTRSLPS